MADETKKLPLMPIEEFVKDGYLQEVNRLFLHPLGLAVVVHKSDDGTYSLMGILDYRKDPTGICFEDITPLDIEKAFKVMRAQRSRAVARFESQGYWVQPLTQAPTGVANDVKDEMFELLRLALNEEYKALMPTGYTIRLLAEYDRSRFPAPNLWYEKHYKKPQAKYIAILQSHTSSVPALGETVNEAIKDAIAKATAGPSH